MKIRLTILFAGIFALMTWATVVASMDRGVFVAGRELWPDPWFRATMLDAYCGFLTFYAWVVYKESRWSMRLTWFLAIMLLGNFAMSAYVLWQLRKQDAFSWEGLLLRARTTA